MMTIQQAIKSEKPFRRKSRPKWLWLFVLPGGQIYRQTDNLSIEEWNPTAEDILAIDWEIKP